MTSAHEFTHALPTRGSADLSAGLGNRECRNHRMYVASSYKCAFKEGLANYGADYAMGSPGGRGDRQGSPPYWTHAGREPANRGNVTALFHDLIDQQREKRRYGLSGLLCDDGLQDVSQLKR